MDPCVDTAGDVGFGAGKLKKGVAVGSVTAGDEFEEGVEACSVANRSGVGVEIGLLHPTSSEKRAMIQKSLNLFIHRTPAKSTRDYVLRL